MNASQVKHLTKKERRNKGKRGPPSQPTHPPTYLAGRGRNDEPHGVALLEELGDAAKLDQQVVVRDVALGRGGRFCSRATRASRATNPCQRWLVALGLAESRQSYVLALHSAESR